MGHKLWLNALGFYVIYKVWHVCINLCLCTYLEATCLKISLRNMQQLHAVQKIVH